MLKSTTNQINAITSSLIKASISSDQNFPTNNTYSGGVSEIAFANHEMANYAFRENSYANIYLHFEKLRVYNMKLIDGAIIQMQYRFKNEEIQQHRLAYFPSPFLEEFQNQPEIYMDDEIYADVVSRNITATPFRFDYDVRPDIYKELSHPISHFTLGQRKGCRIPVTSALPPVRFVDFIIRHFYAPAFDEYLRYRNTLDFNFDESIFPSELDLIHIAIPRAA